jgi:hypothetical protein
MAGRKGTQLRGFNPLLPASSSATPVMPLWVVEKGVSIRYYLRLPLPR